MAKVNLYEVLGINVSDNRNPSAEAIRDAYRAKSKEHHPDRGGDAEKMRAVNEAYAILSDPEKRKHYDETGDDGTNTSEAEKVLGQMFDRFINDPGDIVQKCRDTIHADMATFGLNRAAFTSTLRKQETELRHAVKFKGAGRNLFADAVERRLEATRQQIEQMDSAIVTGNVMLSMLDAYENQRKQPQRSAQQNQSLFGSNTFSFTSGGASFT